MQRTTQAIRPSTSRDEIRVTLPDNKVLSGPPGATIETFLKAAIEQEMLSLNAPLMAAVSNNRLRELNYVLNGDANISPVTLASSDGGRIYRRSLVLLLTTALNELWPGTQVSVNYAVSDGGYYCEILDHPPLSVQQIIDLEKHMRDIVAANDAITRRIVPLEEAAALFAKRGEADKVRLLDYRMVKTMTLYSLRNREDYYYGYMVPSTGYLNLFRLIPVDRGFILQYPRSETVHELRPITLYTKLSSVFKQADEWLERLNIEDIGRLNHLVSNDQIREVILVAEALHEQHIARIATTIRDQHAAGTRIALIAGPSSSGKTTFAKRLAIQLMAHGLHPFTLEMDNYFVDREDTPRDEAGEFDFESIDAMNIPRLNEDLNRLIAGDRVQLPRFNFVSGRSEPGRTVFLREKQIILLEGIHGLNPSLVPNIDKENIFRVYVSALTQLNVDLHNRVPTTDVRLLRRIVRDARSRGWTATDTLQRWRSVRRGEKKNIFPYQENADVMFNSALVYELSALRALAEPLLLQVTPETPPYIEANRLLSFLRWVQPMTTRQQSSIPDTSLLREFTGGSILEDYHPGSSIVSNI